MQKVPSSESGGAPTAWEMVHLKDDGVESSWSTVSFPFVSGGDIGKMTERLPCDGVWLRWTHGSYNYKWHNAPRRQIIASLNGHVEASVGSGDTRRFGPGETLLVEDTRGEGHCTKSLDGVGRWSIFIALPDDGPLAWLFARPTTRELALAALAALAAAALAACALRRPSGAGGLPRRIGLIGGLAPASTIDYYRRINAGVRERLGGRHAAEAVLFSFDQASVIELEFAQRWEEVGEQLARAGLALAAAGCEALLVCCNSVHHEAPPPPPHLAAPRQVANAAPPHAALAASRLPSRRSAAPSRECPSSTSQTRPPPRCPASGASPSSAPPSPPTRIPSSHSGSAGARGGLVAAPRRHPSLTLAGALVQARPRGCARRAGRARGARPADLRRADSRRRAGGGGELVRGEWLSSGGPSSS